MRNDTWKAESEKFRVIESINAGKRDDALNHLDTFCGNIQRSDWTGNIFAGTVYYMLGEKEKGITRVELNVNFRAEQEISKAIVNQMKEGRLDFVKLPGELRKISGLSSMSLGTLKMLAETGDIEAALTLGKIYEDGGISPDRIVTRDYAEAVRWYKKAAYEGSRIAQNAIAHLYFNGGFNLSQSYYDSYIWCCVSEMTKEHFANAAEADSLMFRISEDIAVLSALHDNILSTFVVTSVLLGKMFGEYTIKEIKEQIEGAGWFSFAKLSDKKMNRAKEDARKIMAEIERNIKQKQKQQQ